MEKKLMRISIGVVGEYIIVGEKRANTGGIVRKVLFIS